MRGVGGDDIDFAEDRSVAENAIRDANRDVTIEFSVLVGVREDGGSEGE